VILLSSQFWPMPSMSTGVINCAKLFLSHPFRRIKSIDQWAVGRDPVLTSTTLAKIGKTAIWQRLRLLLLYNSVMCGWVGHKGGPVHKLAKTNTPNFRRLHCPSVCEGPRIARARPRCYEGTWAGGRTPFLQADRIFKPPPTTPPPRSHASFPSPAAAPSSPRPSPCSTWMPPRTSPRPSPTQSPFSSWMPPRSPPRPSRKPTAIARTVTLLHLDAASLSPPAVSAADGVLRATATPRAFLHLPFISPPSCRRPALTSSIELPSWLLHRSLVRPSWPLVALVAAAMAATAMAATAKAAAAVCARRAFRSCAVR